MASAQNPVLLRMNLQKQWFQLAYYLTFATTNFKWPYEIASHTASLRIIQKVSNHDKMSVSVGQNLSREEIVFILLNQLESDKTKLSKRHDFIENSFDWLIYVLTSNSFRVYGLLLFS